MFHVKHMAWVERHTGRGLFHCPQTCVLLCSLLSHFPLVVSLTRVNITPTHFNLQTPAGQHRMPLPVQPGWPHEMTLSIYNKTYWIVCKFDHDRTPPDSQQTGDFLSSKNLREHSLKVPLKIFWEHNRRNVPGTFSECLIHDGPLWHGLPWALSPYGPPQPRRSTQTWHIRTH